MKAVPATAALLVEWPGPPELPSPQTFDALAADLQKAQQEGSLAAAARRLNNYEPGFRTLLLKTVRQLPLDERAPLQRGTPEDRQALGRGGDLAAAEARRDPLHPRFLAHRDGPEGRSQPGDRAGRAVAGDLCRCFPAHLSISASVTLICLILGYPVAWLLATLPARQSNLLMIFVIVPFWTSLLVRTTAWYVLLQPNGVVNSLLVGSGLTSGAGGADVQPHGRADRHDARAAAVHDPRQLRGDARHPAGLSACRGVAGAHPALAFLRVYVPQTMPGIGTGTFLVFVLALGYYITPALLGGAGDEMISQIVALQMDRQLNWGLAGALSVYLVIFTLAVYVVFNKPGRRRPASARLGKEAETVHERRHDDRPHRTPCKAWRAVSSQRRC